MTLSELNTGCKEGAFSSVMSWKPRSINASPGPMGYGSLRTRVGTGEGVSVGTAVGVGGMIVGAEGGVGVKPASPGAAGTVARRIKSWLGGKVTATSAGTIIGLLHALNKVSKITLIKAV